MFPVHNSCSLWEVVRLTREVLQVQLEEAGYELGKPIVHNIDITVAEGEMVGLIGPNGAGKSTTIKAILDLVDYKKGKVHIGGAKQRYAYVPEQPIYYNYLTLWEHLELAAAAFEIEQQQFKQKAEQLLTLFKLESKVHHYPGQFSKGMQQKLMLIIAFLLEPDVYIVDEPFVGLDPRATIDLLALLTMEQQRGAGVLLCTHVLDTAEKICNRFVLLHTGTIVAEGTFSQIQHLAEMDEQATLLQCFDRLTE
ncbi:ABC transporter ATP-binding protein [Paenibacillus yanchengensis]|uniref:ABC transporter ATP-binding protein n=1 Tax=Paenibacillus yanchengensis TaxID=2035833 RepID=A0ABW4YP72_9BACL